MALYVIVSTVQYKHNCDQREIDNPSKASFSTAEVSSVIQYLFIKTTNKVKV